MPERSGGSHKLIGIDFWGRNAGQQTRMPDTPNWIYPKQTSLQREVLKETNAAVRAGFGARGDFRVDLDTNIALQRPVRPQRLENRLLFRIIRLVHIMHSFGGLRYEHYRRSSVTQ